MNLSSFPSRILEETIGEFAKLPGIGKRSALRLALHLLKSPSEDSKRLANLLLRLREEVLYCKQCHNISDKEICQICSNPNRDATQIYVVEDIRDVIAIENTQQYSGRYHVLGGIISPMEGVGPGDLSIDSLLERLQFPETKEVILALSATMEGETTSFYIFKRIQQLQKSELKFSAIARGVSVGDELEYADEVTLGRSILNRVPYDISISR
ncbi:MAG: recombination protein RecR [Bacteroidetes bacterium]|nr:MAG: recombination protein RecR [Bacteroidota bacterium]